ncbi:MAG: single-stranded DNA-specific DHH superfamily exonuclease [Patescibacteria group bacterium]|jgi:single-stranded DNA-specific DHH superfamily exonuclease
MVETDFDGAKKFLDGIRKGDVVTVVHHDDLDGFASGILYFEYCKKKGAVVSDLPFTIGSDQVPIIKQLRHAEKVIICDLGPNTIVDVLDAVKAKNVFYTDHHKKFEDIPAEILEYRTVDEGYIPCARTAYELVGGKYWLGIAGTLSDAGHLHSENKDFLDGFFEKRRIRQKGFLEQVVFTINKFILYWHDKPKKSFRKLMKISEYTDVKALKKYARPVELEIQRFIKGFKKDSEQLGEVSYYYFDPKYPVKSTVTSQLSFRNPKRMFVFANPDGDMVRLSSRGQDKKFNMIEVLKTGIEGLEGATCGGHLPAAGGQIRAVDLEKFKKQIAGYKSE